MATPVVSASAPSAFPKIPSWVIILIVAVIIVIVVIVFLAFSGGTSPLNVIAKETYDSFTAPIAGGVEQAVGTYYQTLYDVSIGTPAHIYQAGYKSAYDSTIGGAGQQMHEWGWW